jgi:LPS export ABC transporter protein LptC
MSLRNVLLALLLTGAAAASWYLNYRPPAIEEPAATEGGESLGYYLVDAVFRRTSPEGRFVYEISAARIDEDPTSDYLSFDDVKISYSESEEIPWLATADHAIAPMNREFIDLHGAVQLRSTDEGSGRATTIETDAMRLEPERYLATTESPVRFAVGDDWLTANSLVADLKSDVIVASDVHAELAR